jgi:hypothetical protein
MRCSQRAVHGTCAVVFTGPNAVDVFARNRITGRLTYQARFPTGGQGDFHEGAFEQHGLVSDGNFLYAVNPGSGDISIFSMRSDGSLRQRRPTPTRGAKPHNKTEKK